MAVSGQGIVPVELAEAAAEFDVLLARNVLIAKKQNAVIEERLVNLAEEGFADFRDVEVTHFRAERVREPAQFQSHGTSSFRHALYIRLAADHAPADVLRCIHVRFLET